MGAPARLEGGRFICCVVLRGGRMLHHTTACYKLLLHHSRWLLPATLGASQLLLLLGCRRLLCLLRHGLGGLINQIDQPPEVDAAVVAQGHLAGAGGGVAVGAAAHIQVLHRRGGSGRGREGRGKGGQAGGMIQGSVSGVGPSKEGLGEPSCQELPGAPAPLPGQPPHKATQPATRPPTCREAPVSSG